MNYKDLEELDALMAKRDHYALEKRGAESLIWNELADSVPALVAEVRRLNLQVGEMRETLAWIKKNHPHVWFPGAGGSAPTDCSICVAIDRVLIEKPKEGS